MPNLVQFAKAQLAFAFPYPLACEVKITPRTIRKKGKDEKDKEYKAVPVQLDMFLDFLADPVIKSDILLSLGKESVTSTDPRWIERIKQIMSLSREQDSEWSCEEIRALHSNLLLESLSFLTGKGDEEDKWDVLCWVYNPQSIERLIDGCFTVRRVQDIEFSFWNCCLSVGITDPDAFREGMVDYMNSKVQHVLRRFLATIH